MDLNKAIEAHVQWKTKFRAAIQKQEQMDVAKISRDDCCELGKWLYADGKKAHGALPSFQEVMTKHTSFHKLAGQVADKINAKKFNDAEAMLGNHQPYAETSAAVCVAIAKLRLDAKL